MHISTMSQGRYGFFSLTQSTGEVFVLHSISELISYMRLVQRREKERFFTPKKKTFLQKAIWKQIMIVFILPFAKPVFNAVSPLHLVMIEKN